MRKDAPQKLLRFSEAISRLCDGMWGGLRRPLPVQAIKRVSSKLSVGFGPQREQAGRIVTAAALKGELTVYLLADSRSGSETRGVGNGANLVVIPQQVLQALLKPRGSLPDHAIRPSLQTAAGDVRLLKALSRDTLVVGASEFDAWYRKERRKGRWPSQHSRSKQIGRPSKQTDALKSAIVALVNDNKWSGKVGLKELHRLLKASGDVPAPDTLSRLVDRLHRETGMPELRRIKRPRSRRAAHAPLTQKSITRLD